MTERDECVAEEREALKAILSDQMSCQSTDKHDVFEYVVLFDLAFLLILRIVFDLK